MVREWFVVKGDTDGKVLAYLKRLRAKHYTLEALKSARLYGGSIALMLIDDGQALEMPLNETRIRTIAGFNVFSRWRTSFGTSMLYQQGPKLGTPEFYDVTPLYGSTPFQVHETRVLRFDGDDVPEELGIQNQGWGDSVLQAPYVALQQLGKAYLDTGAIVDSFVEAVMTIKNLSQLLAAGNDELVKRRLRVLDLSKSIINAKILDVGETYEKKASSVTGLSDLLDRLAEKLCAETEIPFSLLMGRSPAGLQATGASDIRWFYDSISSKQEDELLPPMERLVKLAMLAKDGPSGGKEIKDWAIEFNPLWQLDEGELAKAHLAQAQTDDYYIGNGTLSPQEVADSRFGGDKYSYDTMLDQATRREVPQPAPNPVDPNAPPDQNQA